jgi:NAD(P)-dependent dehydrogenase (short-subunit alcohol dehydrogenase family)
MSSSDRGWTDEDVPRVDGKRFIVTGANSGLGFEMSRVLLRQGAEVVLACRDQGRGQAAVDRLRQGAGGEHASLALLDLGSLASIESFAQRERQDQRSLDVLVCNAGLMAIPDRKTADGFEMTMGVNHLGHFALVGRLLDKLNANPDARVVTLSSNYHKLGKLELLDDLLFEHRKYDRWATYYQSKLANIMFTLELARRLGKAGSSALSVGAHPGYAATELQSHGSQMGAPRWEGIMMAIGNALVAQSVQAGAWPQLRAATDPSAKSGDYYGPKGISEVRGRAVRVEPNTRAQNEEAARKLWSRSEELTRVSFLS